MPSGPATTTPALPWVAVALMLVGMSLIPAGDTAGKLMTSQGISPWFVAWSRFALGAALLAPFMLGGLRAMPALLADWRIWLRGGLVAGTVASILTALATVPLALAFAAFFLGPLLSYALAAAFLGERITPLRTILLIAGFIGVLVVVRPGPGMAPGVGFALLAGVLYGGFLTASRWLRHRARAPELMLSQLLVGAVLLAPGGLAALPDLGPGQGVGLWLGALVLVSALASLAGNLCLILAYGRADASRLAPLVYFKLVAATVLGAAVFGDWPDAIALAGLTILVASGVASFMVRPAR